jgi:hypothetical protein
MIIGNYSVFNKTPGRLFAGTGLLHASGIGQSAVYNRSNWGTTGAMRNAVLPDGSTEVALKLRGIPDGYGGTGWLMPVTEGALSTHNILVGDGDLISAIAGGVNGVAELIGSGDITGAVAQLIVSLVAELSGAGSLSAAAEAFLQLAAALSGSGNVAGALTALGSLIATLEGDGDLTGAATALGTLEAAIVVTGTGLSTANVGSAVWTYLVEAGFDAARVLRIIAAATAGESSGGPSSPVFRDLSDTENMITGTANADGDRSAVTYGG